MSLSAIVLAAALAAAPTPPLGPDRGRHVAERDCAACHAVGPQGRSPNGGAPPFRELSLRYNPISLEAALHRLARQGHFEMPRGRVSDADAEDLAAYIGSLGPR
jgi:mono/diheme cytochrome c family protein